MPLSSYSALEYGVYNINVDKLFTILDVLEADVVDVWPAVGAQPVFNGKSQKRLHEFRLGEIVNLTKAGGAVLFRVTETECSILLRWGLSDTLVQRIKFYMEDGLDFREGLMFSKRQETGALKLFIQAESFDSACSLLIRNYMSLWATVFPD